MAEYVLSYFSVIAQPAGLNILLVDDEFSIRTLLQLLLGTAGHTVKTASHGREALSMVPTSGKRFDVVITDHRMPGMEGLQLARELNSIGFAGSLIVYSGFLTPDVELEYNQVRATVCLNKPVSFETLSKTLARVTATAL